ncbi:MAG: Cytochrome c, partial [Chthoniobacteraceae bacterium]|nr:Cytochrome c [Chthoniobacteraceae bacterium]
MSPRIWFLLLLSFSAFAAEAPLNVGLRELPRFAPLPPEEALRRFVIKSGFHVELVASEPFVSSPVAICFDEDSRIFAAEMRDYSEQRDQTPHLGRIRLLEDLDGDGLIDRSGIFADDLPWPTALFYSNGGLFVCAAPDIWWLKDTDGDGRADVRELIFTGFNSGTARMNVQALPNSFAWGPDNRIHLQTGGANRGLIRCLKLPKIKPQELAGRDFWFDPQTLEFGFESGGGQFGMSYDDEGRRFVCNNSDHLRLYLFDGRYAGRNAFAPMRSPLVSIAADGPAAPVFRISPDEPWRVIRTRWRVSGKVPGIVEGGGRVSGYFTGATGTTVYRGDAFGAGFTGNTFTGDAGGNLVHRKRLRPDGITLIGERPEDEQRAEFLASPDTWFRPVSFANAPDGTLLVIDMYREVIEHPWSIPEPIKEHLDLASGSERGRIWRIVPDGFVRRPLARLAAASNDELVRTLSHSNGWHRDTAARLLIERSDRSIAPAVMEMLKASPSALGRLHALRVLDGIASLQESALIVALNDKAGAVREHAIELCEKLRRDDRAPEAIWNKLSSMVADDSSRVRFQLALTLGGFANEGAALLGLAKRDAADPWISSAIRSGRAERMIELFRALNMDTPFLAAPGGNDFVVQLAAAIGARGAFPEVKEIFGNAARFDLLAALGEGLGRSGHRLAEVDQEERLPFLFAAARVALADVNPAVRIAAIRLLKFDPAAESQSALLDALRSDEPAVREIFESLGQNSVSAGEVIKRWHGFSLPARLEAARFLAATPAAAAVLLESIGQGTIAVADIPAAQAAELRHNRDSKIAAAAARYLPPGPVQSSAEIVARFSPSFELSGDKQKGRVIYQQRCSSCHRFRSEGHAFGPDLESVVDGGKEKLLTHIVDPNREVAPQFAAYTAELDDGTVVSGIL